MSCVPKIAPVMKENDFDCAVTSAPMLKLSRGVRGRAAPAPAGVVFAHAGRMAAGRALAKCSMVARVASISPIVALARLRGAAEPSQ